MASQQAGALPQQPAVTGEQFPVGGLQLQHHPVQPLTPEHGLATDQGQIQGAEAHTAERSQKIRLAGQGLLVPPPLTTAPLAQMQADVLQPVLSNPSMDPAVGSAQPDQVRVGGSPMGTQTAQQFHGLKEVGFTRPVGPDKNDPIGLHL